MRIGAIFHTTYALASVQFVTRELVRQLSRSHCLAYLPPEHAFECQVRQREVADGLVQQSDLLIGYHSTLAPALEARARLDLELPCILFLLGALSRGGPCVAELAPFLTNRDVLVANCTADVELAHRYFKNARVELVPFSYDASAFHPVISVERRAMRARLRLSPDDPVILYAGRVTLEKNVHSVLRVFSALRHEFPDLRLLIAGRFADDPFREFGVAPVNLRGILANAANTLEIPRDRIRVLSPSSPAQLRLLYGVADILVNLTLNHDENFGLAQVEAMACGTPVVGTLWGGLKDTIIEDGTGFGVSTEATPTGVKVNWSEAVDRIGQLLSDPAARERVRAECIRRAASRYGPASYGARLEEIIVLALAGRPEPKAPLEPTPFARELWDHRRSPGALYRHGEPSFELYRSLIATYTGATKRHIRFSEPLALEQTLTLVCAATLQEGRLEIDDPLFPIGVEIPSALTDAVGAVLAALTLEPCLTAGCLLTRWRPEFRETIYAAVEWLNATGIVLRSRIPTETIARLASSGRLGNELFGSLRTTVTVPRLFAY